MSQARSNAEAHIRNQFDDPSITVTTIARWMLDADLFEQKMDGTIDEDALEDYYVKVTVRPSQTDIDYVTAKMDELGYDLGEAGWEAETLDQRDLIGGEQSGRVAYFA